MKKTSIMILVLVVALASCKKTPEVNLKYVDVERDLITVGATTATVQCDYQYIATLKKAYFYYGEGTDETNMTSAEMRVVQNTLYVELVELREHTTYSYYYEFHNGFNSMRSATKSFKTETSPETPHGLMLPTVVTAAVTEITANSAKSGGEVTNDGGAEVIERGICWSAHVNPTLNDAHVAIGTGMGIFTAEMCDLSDETVYHVRAYAISAAGPAYGMDREFATLSDVPIGAINGKFSINESGDQVYFSQGNLQYIGSAITPYWKFAEKQWDYFGTTTGQNSDRVDVDRDLFGWGTSGWDNGSLYYHPYNTEGQLGVPYQYGPFDGTSGGYGLYGSYSNADWGVYNAVLNGGNIPNWWRTLTRPEWQYVVFYRSTLSGIRFAMAQVNGVNGIILLPDNWIATIHALNEVNVTNSSYTANVINVADWMTMENHGAVFLPAAGCRVYTDVRWCGLVSEYWTASYLDGIGYNGVQQLCLFDAQLSSHDGRSVRLVHNAYLK